MLWHGTYLVKAQYIGDKSNCISRCVIVPGIVLLQAINAVKSYTHRSRKREFEYTMTVFICIVLTEYVFNGCNNCVWCELWEFHILFSLYHLVHFLMFSSYCYLNQQLRENTIVLVDK